MQSYNSVDEHNGTRLSAPAPSGFCDDTTDSELGCTETGTISQSLTEVDPGSVSQPLKTYLGNIAKFASPPPPTPENPTVMKFYLQSLARELLPRERVGQCLRKVVPGCEHVEIVIDQDAEAAHYRNLITCGRLWFCPVCASRITEHRAEELTRATARWHHNGGFVALLTFTLRHNHYTPLHDTLAWLRDAHRRFKSGAPFQRIASKYGWEGSVTALEVTHGEESGWHPHLHELVFFTPMSLGAWGDFILAAKKRWKAQLAALGVDVTWANGLDIRDGDEDIQNYVAKYGKLPERDTWTIEREITKAPSKRSRVDGRTPFALLIDYGDGDDLAGQLFQAYATCFKGRKQLVWSRGMRAKLELGEEIADEDVAQVDSEWEVLATLPTEVWRRLMAHPRDLRAELLTVASKGDKSVVMAFLSHFGLIPY